MRSQKRTIHFILRMLPVWLILLSVSGSVSASNRTATSTTTLTACGHPFYPPVSWHYKNQLIGVAPAVTRQLFAELGYRVELSADSNWKRCLREVERGNVDLIVAAYQTQQRQQWLDFTQQPIIADHITLFSRRSTHTAPYAIARPLLPTNDPIDGRQPLLSLDRLRQRTVGLLLGDSFGDSFDQFVQQHSRIEYVSRGQQNFAKLALGRIDYMPIGQLTGQLQSQKLGYAAQLQVIEPPITTEYYYLALGKHSQLHSLLPHLNQRLAQLHQDGTLQRLTQHYSLEYLKQVE